ncbi:hypothetical protein GGE07_004025 [Sinorhizobium terangae]|uniref:Uncharacterized protein n=1 Tax=Sinorhizobium terangae TaxID=110322 RepID=A0A6N7L9W0_SINTE|nr:hypothetical protein [Sinorhizobium terangae]MBB4187361.1 hypothetical protein [Sinorhizobium terangae]MQX14633.1 hypothetical protein [Sinorhizobium terangae]
MDDTRIDGTKQTLALTNPEEIPAFRQHVDEQFRAEIEPGKPDSDEYLRSASIPDR